MVIRLTCNQCTTAFTVDSDRAGAVIACPTCTKEHRVPAPTLDTASAEATDPMAEDTEYTLSPAVELPVRHGSPTAAPRTQSHPSSPRPLPAATKSPAVSQSPSDAADCACGRCGKVLDAQVELCPHCFYHNGLKRVVDIRDPDDPLLSEHGFRRFLLAKLNKDQSPESVFFLVDAMVLLAGVLLYVISHSLAAVLVPLVVIYLIYRITVRIRRLWYRGRTVLWYTVLLLGRSLSWRTLGGQQRKHATRRGDDFGDANLESLPELNSYAVLDLEGSAITDEGLAPLKHREALEFLILRKTRVTPEGVWELQQTIPHTCIWY